MAKLSVNVNAIAHLRNRRNLPWPDLVYLSKIALQSGAHGITVHPRPDQRHIRHQDVDDLHKLIRQEFPKAEYNIEGYPALEFLRLVETYPPDQVTLVPDAIDQATSDHGWDIKTHRHFLKEVIGRLQAKGMRVSLFIDADCAMVEPACEAGADRVEIFTGPYGVAPENRVPAELSKIVATAQEAQKIGIGINAGHDLTRANLPALITALPYIREVSIGHALISDALELGLSRAVQSFQQAAEHKTPL